MHDEYSDNEDCNYEDEIEFEKFLKNTEKNKAVNNKPNVNVEELTFPSLTIYKMPNNQFGVKLGIPRNVPIPQTVSEFADIFYTMNNGELKPLMTAVLKQYAEHPDMHDIAIGILNLWMNRELGNKYNPEKAFIKPRNANPNLL